MAASTYDLQQRAATEATLEAKVFQLQIDLIGLSQRIDRSNSRINWAMGIAIVATVIGAVFGVINFTLLLQLISRLG